MQNHMWAQWGYIKATIINNKYFKNTEITEWREGLVAAIPLLKKIKKILTLTWITFTMTNEVKTAGCTFVEDSKETLFLWEEPLSEAWHSPHVGTCADH